MSADDYGLQLRRYRPGLDPQLASRGVAQGMARRARQRQRAEEEAERRRAWGRNGATILRSYENLLAEDEAAQRRADYEQRSGLEALQRWHPYHLGDVDPGATMESLRRRGEHPSPWSEDERDRQGRRAALLTAAGLGASFALPASLGVGLGTRMATGAALNTALDPLVNASFAPDTPIHPTTPVVGAALGAGVLPGLLSLGLTYVPETASTEAAPRQVSPEVEELLRWYRGRGYAGGGLVSQGQRMLRRAQPSLERAGDELDSSPAGALGVVRKRGSQFYDVGDRLGRALRRLHTWEAENGDDASEAVNRWVDTTLRKYLVRDLGSEDDPILQRTLRGEPIHLTTEQLAELGAQTNERMDQKLLYRRRRSKLYPPGSRMLGRSHWEDLADAATGTFSADSLRNLLEMPGGELPTELAWLGKLPDEELMASIAGFQKTPARSFSNLGFDHLIDYLQRQVDAGHMRPEALQRLSVGDAVAGAARWNEELAASMAKRQANLSRQLPALREYPEGLRWVELREPEEVPEGFNDKADFLEALLASEGDVMGHCVGGYCSDVLAGRSRIFSLRDADGDPHVTIEVQPSLSQQHLLSAIEEALGTPKFEHVLRQLGPDNQGGSYPESVHRLAAEMFPSKIPPPGSFSIAQIRGKRNAAPVDRYLPMVQDFVRNSPLGSPWYDVQELENARLRSYPDNVLLSDEDARRIIESMQERGTIGVGHPLDLDLDHGWLHRYANEFPSGWDYVRDAAERLGILPARDAGKGFAHGGLAAAQEDLGEQLLALASGASGGIIERKEAAHG